MKANLSHCFRSGVFLCDVVAGCYFESVSGAGCFCRRRAAGQEEMDSVLMPKFSALIKGWLGFLGTDERLRCLFISGKKDIEMFWLDFCDAVVL